MDSAWVTVGKVTKPVGLKGWVAIVTFSDNPDRFVPGAVMQLASREGALTPVKILDVRPRSRTTMLDLLFEGSLSREDAEAFAGKELFIPKADRAPLPEDQFYPDEIAGMELLSEQGTPAGKVLALESEVASPYLRIITPKFGEVMIPFRKDFIAKVDRSKRRIQLCSPIEWHVPTDA